jgi:hypothetical protein
MLLVERIARGQRSRELREDFRQKTVMEMDHGLTPILARSHQLDGDAVRVGIGLELRVPTKKCPYKPCQGKSTETSALLAIGCSDISRFLG